MTLSDANARMFRRHLPIIEAALERGDAAGADPRLSLENLDWMCRTASDPDAMAEDKSSRWLGFVQGCLAMRGLIDVDTERDVTRPLFHGVRQAAGLPAPETLARDT